jgi:putative transcriptional regulator
MRCVLLVGFAALSGFLGSSLYAQARVKAGQLLVATGRLNDPEFSQSVVLILASGPEGVLGIWINRQTKVTVQEIFPELRNSAPVFQGGPLRIGINGLLRAKEPPQGGSRLLDDVWVITEQAALRKLAARAGGLRIVIGTCGWSVPQLADEIDRREAWTIRNATPEIIFDPDPGTLWNRLSGSNIARGLSFPPPPLFSLASAR